MGGPPRHRTGQRQRKAVPRAGSDGAGGPQDRPLRHLGPRGEPEAARGAHPLHPGRRGDARRRHPPRPGRALQWQGQGGQLARPGERGHPLRRPRAHHHRRQPRAAGAGGRGQAGRHPAGRGGRGAGGDPHPVRGCRAERRAGAPGCDVPGLRARRRLVRRDRPRLGALLPRCHRDEGADRLPGPGGARLPGRLDGGAGRGERPQRPDGGPHRGAGPGVVRGAAAAPGPSGRRARRGDAPGPTGDDGGAVRLRSRRGELFRPAPRRRSASRATRAGERHRARRLRAQGAPGRVPGRRTLGLRGPALGAVPGGRAAARGAGGDGAGEEVPGAGDAHPGRHGAWDRRGARRRAEHGRTPGLPVRPGARPDGARGEGSGGAARADRPAHRRHRAPPERPAEAALPVRGDAAAGPGRPPGASPGHRRRPGPQWLGERPADRERGPLRGRSPRAGSCIWTRSGCSGASSASRATGRGTCASAADG